MANRTSLITDYFVVLCFTEEGLLANCAWAPWLVVDPPPPFLFTCYGPTAARPEFGGETELNKALLWVVVVIVKVEGFETAAGLLFEIFKFACGPTTTFCFVNVGCNYD